MIDCATLRIILFDQLFIPDTIHTSQAKTQYIEMMNSKSYRG